MQRWPVIIPHFSSIPFIGAIIQEKIYVVITGRLVAFYNGTELNLYLL
jgi:hypothetical protein